MLSRRNGMTFCLFASSSGEMMNPAQIHVLMDEFGALFEEP